MAANKVLTLKTLLVILECVLTALAAEGQTKQPKTVRDFFMLISARYFSLDCCETKDRRKGLEKYLKTYLEIEDTANGFMSGGSDAAQEGFEMALFKRSNGTYLIGFYTFGEGGIEDTPWVVFLEYRNGRWTDVSKREIPGYSPTTLEYKLPRVGTTIQVFKKVEEGDAPKRYDLVWKAGKFVRSG